MVGIFCFRNDLRLDNNPALDLALKECSTLHLVYVFEDRIWKSSNFKRISFHRANFLLETLHALTSSIAKLGGNFETIKGNIEFSLPKYMDQKGAEICFLSEENAWEEKQVESALAQKVPTKMAYARTLIHPNDLPFALHDLPQTFSKFRKMVEKNLMVRPILSPPTDLSKCKTLKSCNLPSLDELGINEPPQDKRKYFTFEGGSSAATTRIRDWLWSKHALRTYKKTRNDLIGSDFSSRLSPWLANGSLSPHEVYQEIKNYESEFGANESTYWLIFELLWRDFFHFQARLHGAKIFQKCGIRPKKPVTCEPSNAKILFSDWKDGETENSFVNANMNELRLTGWMSNRGRQNVASYLINDLGLDWRKGATWFEEQLLDYDPCCNYGNWLYLSGYGNDPRNNRYFNISKQAETYDPSGKFEKYWK